MCPILEFLVNFGRGPHYFYFLFHENSFLYVEDVNFVLFDGCFHSDGVSISFI